MRRWGLPAVALVLISARASAQEAEVSAGAGSAAAEVPAQAIVYGAMPGGLRASTAEVLPKGVVQVSSLAGLGRRSGLLGADHKFNRGIGDLAIAFGATDFLSMGLSLDGRYDRHWGKLGDPAMPSGAADADDGYVGDPHLIVRVAKPAGATRVGGQLGIWVPGNRAPSVSGSAISIDARGLVSLAAGPGWLSASGGFRLDNSVNSVDDPFRLSLPDRVSLGVSDYHALFATAQFRMPAGDAWVGLEGSLEALVGGPADPTAGQVRHAELERGKLTLRAGVTAGYPLTSSLSAAVFFEATKGPGINLTQILDGNIPIVAYEPMFAGGVGLQARFGGARGVSTTPELDCAKRDPPDCPVISAPILVDINGTVIDVGGKPLAGATVSLSLQRSQVEPTKTDAQGAYVFKGVPIGSIVDRKSTVDELAAEIQVALDGMKPGKATLSPIQQPSNTVPPITLEPDLPPGQLRGVVRSLAGGRAVAGATITVEPGGAKAESDADGTFTIDLAPGVYKIKVKAPGFKEQALDLKIDPNGVAIKNIDLQK